MFVIVCAFTQFSNGNDHIGLRVCSKKLVAKPASTWLSCENVEYTVNQMAP